MVAVDLGARCDEHPLPEPRGVLEHVLRPLDVRQQRVPRALDDQPDPDDRGQVVDDVAAVHELADDRRREHGIDDEMELRALREVSHVPLRSGREVVERPDLCSRVEQALGEV